MSPFLHHSTKYDGTLHYKYRASLVTSSDEVLVVYVPPGTRMESYRGTVTGHNHTLHFFYPHLYHNTIVFWHADWSPRMHYVNIATPAVWDSSTVSTVDLDLDVIRFSDTGRVIVDDEDEFLEHSAAFGYPDDLVERCRTEVSDVQALIQDDRGVFSDAAFAWRPGQDLDPEFLAG